MSSQPPPASSGGTLHTPPSAPAPTTRRVTYGQRCVVLVDWWLERVEGQEGKIRVAGTPNAPQMRKEASSIGNIKGPSRTLRSAPIAKRLDYTALQTEDGYIIRISRPLNTRRTPGNGFFEEVCESFTFGFPIQWLKLVNPNMEQQNVQAQSESTANAPRHSVEYYMEKYSSDSFTTFMRYAFTEKDFFSSKGCTGNMDGPHGTADNSPKVVIDPEEVAHGAKRSLVVRDHTADNLPKVVIDPEEAAHSAKRSLEVGNHEEDVEVQITHKEEAVSKAPHKCRVKKLKEPLSSQFLRRSTRKMMRSLEVGDHEEDVEVQITHKEEAVSEAPHKCRVKKLKEPLSSEFLRRSTRINKKA